MERIDTVHTFETPEGVDLALHVAGPVPRALAFVLDALLRYGALLALAIVLLPLGGLGVGVLLILTFLAEWLYPVLFEVTRGQTPGKKAMGLTVVHQNGTPVTWPSSLIRNLLRVVDFLPLFYGLGAISMLVDHRFRRLGDLAAGTLVVHAPAERVAAALPDRPPLAPPVPLGLEEMRAIIDFAERADLAPERRAELAGLLTHKQGEAAVEEMLGYASWLGRGQ